jgi:stearoyl-CoA desaturase (delta-9 desaturase)
MIQAPEDNLSAQNPSSPPTARKEVDWSMVWFLTVIPLVGIAGLIWQLMEGHVTGWQIGFALAFAALANFGITGGYHRLFAHKSYEAHPLVEIVYLLIGAAAWQGPALKWASDHRRHHTFEDTDGDPYAITKGFWHAHMGWLFDKKYVDLPIKAPDLQKKYWLQFQSKHYVAIAVLFGFGFPTLVGYFLGSAWTGFFVGGLLRALLNQQSGFVINSLCHMFGRQTYSKDITARDSFVLALFTHGEGYHNFHHKFQFDYRNGVRWYQWDPTKWIIRSLAFLGLAKKLRRIPASEILKAKLQAEEFSIKARGVSHEMVESMQKQVLQAQARWRELVEEYNRKKQEMAEASHVRLAELKAEIEKARLEFQYAMKLWHLEVRRS